MLLKKFSLENDCQNNLQNSGDPDQMPHYVASDLSLHFLPIPLIVPL